MLEIRTPASRLTDPETSHLAAEHMNASGKRGHQQRQALELVRKYPNHTSDELADYGVLDRYQLARRLPELETAKLVERGPARRSAKTGRQAQTWHAK